MTEWMIELERLKKLLDAGALTHEEFEQQKARLLTGANPPLTAEDEDEGAPDDEPCYIPSFSPRPWLIGSIGALSLGLVAYFFWSSSSESSDPTLLANSEATMPTSIAAETQSAEPEPPEAPDLSSTLQFSSLSECIAGEVLERIYGKLDKAMEHGDRGLSIKLDAFPDGLPISAKASTDAERIYEAKADVRFPENTSWYGLRLSRITAEHYVPPDSDSYYARTINFLEPPSEVRRILGGMGVGAKLEPEFTELPDTYNSCGGAMQIVELPGGAALSCGWGC